MIVLLMILVMFSKFNPHTGVQILDKNNFVSESLKFEGSQEMNIDGSVTPKIFKAVPDPGEYWMVSKFVIALSDMGNFRLTDFGSLPKLTNGVSVLTEDAEFLVWNDNADIGISTGEIQLISNPPETILVGEWDFTDYGGAPNTFRQGIRINDSESGISFKIQDDLTGLIAFRVRIEGMRFKKPIN